MDKIPALYIGHGAPMLLDDPIWAQELSLLGQKISSQYPAIKNILIISAHWETSPIALSNINSNSQLVYDFSGFDSKFYQLQYNAPTAPDLAQRLTDILGGPSKVHQSSQRGLDHGAYIPLLRLFPQANIPTLQLSIPTLDAQSLFDLGRKLAPLREEGTLLIASGFLTHGLRYLKDWSINAQPPTWSTEFDQWAAETLANGRIDTLLDYKNQAPATQYAHPTVEHFAPIFIALGSADNPEHTVETQIQGYWMGLSKRSFIVN